MESLERQLSAVLNDYSDELKEEVIQAIKTSADTTTKLLRTVADQLHHRTGDYAKGWTVTKVETSWNGIKATVYNKTKPGLAHLLEHKHEIIGPDGESHGWSTPQPHIAQVNDWVQAEIVKRITQNLQK